MRGAVRGTRRLAAVAAVVGIGVTVLWRRRNDIRVAVTLAGATIITTVLSYFLLQRNSDWLPWLGWVILVAGLTAARPEVSRRLSAGPGPAAGPQQAPAPALRPL